MRRYGIVTAGAFDELVREVNRMQAQGWEPIGGVAVSVVIVDDQEVNSYSQAMRETEDVRGTLTTR
jgi:hypothetical protein